MEPIILWSFIASLTALILFGIDKSKAKQKKWRIPENTLIWISVLGGGLGALLGMLLFRHKTRRLKFLLGIPLCIVLNGITAYLFYQYPL